MLLSGCSAAQLLSSGPTAIPGISETAVAQTVAAALTQTAALATPTETLTSTPLPTPTETFTPTVTLTPFLGAYGGELTCRVLSQSLRNGTRYGPSERFEMGWKVRNTSGVDWNPSEIDFVFFGGTKMYQAAQYPLGETVTAGDTVALGASLVSPKKSGTFTTTWALRRGQNTFCYVSLKIVVP